jgi:hypothetical protein
MQIVRGAILLLLAPAAAGQTIGPPTPWEAEAPPAHQATAAPAPPQHGGAPDIERRPLGGAHAGDGSAPVQRRAPASGGLGVGRTAISLGVVVALAALFGGVYRQWALKRGGLAMAMGAGGRAPSGVLEVLARYPAPGGLTLVLLKLDQRVLLLAQNRLGRLRAGSSMRVLCEVTDAEEVASLVARCRDEAGESMAGRFRSMLRQFEGDEEDLGQVEGEEPLRFVQYSTDGDSVELWDTGEEDDPWAEGARAGSVAG